MVCAVTVPLKNSARVRRWQKIGTTAPSPSRLGFLFCSAGPRGLCGDPRIFDDLTKVPQVFRDPGGSPALQNERPIRRRLFYQPGVRISHASRPVAPAIPIPIICGIDSLGSQSEEGGFPLSRE